MGRVKKCPWDCELKYSADAVNEVLARIYTVLHLKKHIRVDVLFYFHMRNLKRCPGRRAGKQVPMGKFLHYSAYTKRMQ